MTANQHTHKVCFLSTECYTRTQGNPIQFKVQLAACNERDAKQQWEFESC